jgi:predicted transcriptional regulator
MSSHSELVERVAGIMHHCDFTVYYNEGMRQYFDLIGIGKVRLFVKVLANIDNLRREEGEELRRFASAFSSESFIVGEHAGAESLADEVIYRRFDNPCMNSSTFLALLSGESVNRFTKRGHLLLSIDGSEVQKAREAAGLTREQLAEALNCAPKTIQRVEKENRIQEAIFESLLGVLEGIKPVGTLLTKDPNTNQTPQDPQKREVARQFLRLKLEAVSFKNPLDFAIEEKPLLSPLSRSEAELRRKQRVAGKLSDILECEVIHITAEKKTRRLHSISLEQLRKLHSKEELFEEYS